MYRQYKKMRGGGALAQHSPKNTKKNNKEKSNVFMLLFSSCRSVEPGRLAWNAGTAGQDGLERRNSRAGWPGTPEQPGRMSWNAGTAGQDCLERWNSRAG